MRILQVNSAEGLGGGEVHVLELTRYLRERGHDVRIAGRPGSAISPDIHFPFLNSADVFTAYRLRQLIRKERFDVVHVHVARDYTVAAVASAGLRNFALVMTRHLLYPVHPHLFYRRVDGWIAPTSQILKTLAPLKPRRSAVIPNWVDLARFPFRPRTQFRQPVALGLLGQISPHKGHDDAIEALRLLGNGYRLLIAGKGEPRYVEDLKKRAEGLAVEFMGFAPLPEFLDMTDIFLVPSWEEPFGIVLLEAMASGIPLISTAAGGPLDIVRSGVDGLLVPPRNPQSIAGAVTRLCGDASLRSAMVQSARQRVEAAFDIQKVIPAIENFYRSLLKGGV